MHGNELFLHAFIYLGAAVIAVPLAKRLGLGSVLGYLLAGVIIGPYVLGLVGDEGQDVMHFAEFGVVMMLFLVGLELQPSLLWKLRAPILGLGGMQVGLTTLAITGVVIATTSLVWQSALAIGLSLALSSTAIVIQTLNEKGLMKTDGGQNAFSVLLFQDIAVIPILAIFPLLATFELHHADGHHDAQIWIDHFPIAIKTLLVFGGVAVIIIGGKYLIGPILRIIAQTRLNELFTAAALLLIIGIALLMTQVGLSPALGTFLAGVVLAQSEYRHELETDIEPFKGLLLGLFFIAVGSSIDFQLIASRPIVITGIVFALIAIKFLILLFVGRVFGMKHDNNFLFTFSLAQGGEFAFVLLSFALQNGVLNLSIANPVIASVAISMTLSPVLMLINEHLIQPRFGTKENDERDDDTIEERGKVIIAGFGRYGSTVGRFLQANGVMATYLDIDPNNVDLLRKIGLNVYYGDASRRHLLEAAGAEEASMLIVAVDEPSKTLQIIETAQKYYPHLKILARTRGWLDSYDLIDKNIDGIYREYTESALRLGADALAKLGLRKYQLNRSMKLFRKHDERIVRKLALVRKEKGALILNSKLGIEEIEKMLKADEIRIGDIGDNGWDVTSRREEAIKRLKEDKEFYSNK